MGKTWLITGCSEGGIGAAVAHCALEAGNKVVVTARNTAKVAGIIKDFPDTAFPVTLDVTDQESVKTAVANAVEHFGTIDVLVNNAGYCYRASVEKKQSSCYEAAYRYGRTSRFWVQKIKSGFWKISVPVMWN